MVSGCSVRKLNVTRVSETHMQGAYLPCDGCPRKKSGGNLQVFACMAALSSLAKSCQCQTHSINLHLTSSVDPQRALIWSTERMDEAHEAAGRDSEAEKSLWSRSVLDSEATQRTMTATSPARWSSTRLSGLKATRRPPLDMPRRSLGHVSTHSRMLLTGVVEMLPLKLAPTALSGQTLKLGGASFAFRESA